MADDPGLDSSAPVGFAALDDLALQRVLSFASSRELLGLALLSRETLNVARCDGLWDPFYRAAAAVHPLGFPVNRNAPHPLARLAPSRLRALRVSALKALALEGLLVNKRALAACSEKDEICRLVVEAQGRVQAELAGCGALHGGRAMERELCFARFADYWCGLHDLRRRHLLEHELVSPHQAWGMFWLPSATGLGPASPLFGHWHTTMRYSPDGSYDSDDPQLNSRNTNQSWVRELSSNLVKSPHGGYPPLAASRTPSGGWRLTNLHVVMLRLPTPAAAAAAAAAAATTALGADGCGGGGGGGGGSGGRGGGSGVAATGAAAAEAHAAYSAYSAGGDRLTDAHYGEGASAAHTEAPPYGAPYYPGHH